MLLIFNHIDIYSYKSFILSTVEYFTVLMHYNLFLPPTFVCLFFVCFVLFGLVVVVTVCLVFAIRNNAPEKLSVGISLCSCA